MAIVFDASTAGSINVGGTSLVIAHTTTASANRVMIIGASLSAGACVIQSITYGAASATRVGTVASGTAGTDRRTEVWQIIAPPSGGNFGTINFTTVGTFTSGVGVIGFSTFSGADQTTPLSNLGSVTGNNTSSSLIVNSTSGNMIFDVMCVRSTTTLNIGADQTSRYNTSINGNIQGAMSTEDGASSGTLSWSWTASDVFAQIAGNINAAAGGGATSSIGYRSLLGVGI